MTPAMMLLALLGAHGFFDYGGQGDFQARAKNVSAPIPGVPWYQALTAHAFTHGAAVGLITGSFGLGLAETVAHWATDYAKCRGWIGFNTDQLVHIACKVAWVAIVTGAA